MHVHPANKLFVLKNADAGGRITKKGDSGMGEMEKGLLRDSTEKRFSILMRGKKFYSFRTFNCNCHYCNPCISSDSCTEFGAGKSLCDHLFQQFETARSGVSQLCE